MEEEYVGYSKLTQYQRGLIMLSVCIITKNESTKLKECLKRLAPYGFEIVVVDTGSTDNSKEVALNYTDYVYDFKWCDDFSAARNYAASKATGEYILVLDTDEYIEKLDKSELLRLIHANPGKVGQIHRKNTFFTDGKESKNSDYATRLYSKKLFHFEGRIHEQIMSINPSTHPKQLYILPISVDHDGYLGSIEERNKKAKRNLDLLLLDLKEKGPDPYTLYQIGKSYYYMQQYEESIPYFEQALEFPLDMHLDYVANMIVTYGYALLNLKQTKKALMLEALYEDLCQNADYLFVLGLTYMQNAIFDLAVTCFLQATKITTYEVEGVNSYLAFYNIGVIYECIGDMNSAREYYLKCGFYEPALQGLKRCDGK